MSNINISLKNANGIVLQTEDTYCEENIRITPVLQEKTVIPTLEEQTILPDTDNVGISKVTVEAIQTEIKSITSNGTYTPTSGKYFSSVSVDIPDTPAPTLDGTAIADKVLLGYTFYNTDTSTKVTGTIPTYNNAYLPILSAPKNLSIDILTLTFSAVSEATSYNIYANDTLLGSSTSTQIKLINLKNYESLAYGTYNISVEATGTGFANSKRSISVSFTKSAGYTVSIQYDKNASDNNVSFTVMYTDGSEVSFNEVNYPLGGHSYNNVIAITTSDYLEITENGVTKSIQGTYILTANIIIKRTLIAACISAETLVTMADNTTKKLGDIEVGDEVLSIDYNTMSLVSRKVIYSGRDEPGYNHWYVDSYWENVYSDGTVIKQAMKHRFYNLENQSYVYLDYWNVGEHTYKIDGTNPYLVSRTLKQGRLNYARITLENSNNYFANNLSTGDRNCCPNPVILNGVLETNKKEG